MNYQGMNALITGASSGLGEQFAEQLARQGCNLVLVARSNDKMNRLAESLRQRCHVEVNVISTDLSRAEAVHRLIADVKSRDVTIDLLVNNAGLGVFENFLDTSLERQLEQIDVNVRALVALTHAFAPAMVVAGRGGVINLASNAGFQPLPGAAVYAASKAFVIFFSRGLAYELEKSKVRVTVVCPGPVATAFFADKNPKLQPKQMDQPAAIVSEVLRAFAKGKKVVIPGKFSNRLSAFGVRFMPSPLIVRIAAGLVQQLNQKQVKCVISARYDVVTNHLDQRNNAP